MHEFKIPLQHPTVIWLPFPSIYEKKKIFRNIRFKQIPGLLLLYSNALLFLCSLCSGLVHGWIPQQPLCAGVQVDARLHELGQLHVSPAAPPVVRNRSGGLQRLHLL